MATLHKLMYTVYCLRHSYTLRLQIFAVLIFAFFFAIVSRTAKFNTSKNLSCKETVMNVFGLAKFNTSKVYKT